MQRYNQWFWNGFLINWFSKRICKIENWLWNKQYGTDKAKGNFDDN